MTPQQWKEKEREKMAANKKPKTEEPAHKRRGLKSSEFWLAAVTSIVTLAILGGWVDIEGTSTADRVCAMIAMGLSSLGYTVGRSWIKTKTAEMEE